MSYLTDLLGDSYKEGMSIEDVSKVLESMNLIKANETKDSDNESLKRQLSKVNAEAAKYKNQLRDLMNAEDRKKAEREEEIEQYKSANEELQTQVASLTKTINLATNKEKFVAMGYSNELASKASKAVIDGDVDALLGIQKEFVDARNSELKAELMKGMTPPASGSNETTITKEALMKMSASERIAWAMKDENQAQYEQLMQGE